MLSVNYRINEQDLGELERILPALSEATMSELTPRLRTQLRRAKQILSDVRWHYGPAENVEVLPDTEDD